MIVIGTAVKTVGCLWYHTHAVYVEVEIKNYPATLILGIKTLGSYLNVRLKLTK